MPTNAALVSAPQRPLSALVSVLQQSPSPVSPCSYHTATLVTDPTITALATINLFHYATIPTTKALASYATTSVAIILASYATIFITTIATDTQPRVRGISSLTRCGLGHSSLRQPVGCTPTLPPFS